MHVRHNVLPPSPSLLPWPHINFGLSRGISSILQGKRKPTDPWPYPWCRLLLLLKRLFFFFSLSLSLSLSFNGHAWPKGAWGEYEGKKVPMELLVFSRLMVSPLLPVSIHLLLVGYIQWLPTPSTGDPVLSSSIFHFADVICIFFFFFFFFYEILKGKHDKSIFVEIFLFWYFFFFFLFFFFFFLEYKVRKKIERDWLPVYCTVRDWVEPRVNTSLWIFLFVCDFARNYCKNDL